MKIHSSGLNKLTIIIISNIFFSQEGHIFLLYLLTKRDDSYIHTFYLPKYYIRSYCIRQIASKQKVAQISLEIDLIYNAYCDNT